MSKDGLGRLAVLTAFLLSSHCSTTAKKQRLVQKDHIVASKKVLCDRVDGEKYSDVDVLLTINMGERCDFSKPFAITDYRSAEDIPYIVYCCNLLETKVTSVVEIKTQAKPTENSGVTPQDNGNNMKQGVEVKNVEGSGSTSTSGNTKNVPLGTPNTSETNLKPNPSGSQDKKPSP